MHRHALIITKPLRKHRQSMPAASSIHYGGSPSPLFQHRRNRRRPRNRLQLVRQSCSGNRRWRPQPIRTAANPGVTQQRERLLLRRSRTPSQPQVESLSASSWRRGRLRRIISRTAQYHGRNRLTWTRRKPTRPAQPAAPGQFPPRSMNQARRLAHGPHRHSRRYRLQLLRSRQRK
jgi:hypothetical protein